MSRALRTACVRGEGAVLMELNCSFYRGGIAPNLTFSFPGACIVDLRSP